MASGDNNFKVWGQYLWNSARWGQGYYDTD